MRKNHQDYIAFKQSLEQQDRQRRDADFARRQRERVAAEERPRRPRWQHAGGHFDRTCTTGHV